MNRGVIFHIINITGKRSPRKNSMRGGPSDVYSAQWISMGKKHGKGAGMDPESMYDG